jgi:hypothetical protein
MIPDREPTGTDNAFVSEALVVAPVPLLHPCLPPLWGYVALRWLTKNDFQ